MNKNTARILIVDDEPHMRRLNEFSLRGGGFDSFYFGQNGREAVEIAHEVHPDLIIIDYMMPEMDGLGALRDLKAKPDTSGIPVIMVSGCGEFHTHRKAESAAASAVLKKPYNPSQLVETVQRTLDRQDKPL